MDIQSFYDYCLAKKGVTEHFPFDEDTLVFKVGGKMFALSSLKEWENATPSINLKCDPERGIELREEYESVKAGYHMSKVHWNTVDVNGDVPLPLLKELIDHSYDLVFKSLTKKIKAEILEKDN